MRCAIIRLLVIAPLPKPGSNSQATRCLGGASSTARQHLEIGPGLKTRIADAARAFQPFCAIALCMSNGVVDSEPVNLRQCNGYPGSIQLKQRRRAESTNRFTRDGDPLAHFIRSCAGSNCSKVPASTRCLISSSGVPSIDRISSAVCSPSNGAGKSGGRGR